MKDRHGFEVWTAADRQRMWDDKITIERMLLDACSARPVPVNAARQELGNDLDLPDTEQLFAFRYGGVLSSRWGYLVVAKAQPDVILRAVFTRMS